MKQDTKEAIYGGLLILGIIAVIAAISCAIVFLVNPFEKKEKVRAAIIECTNHGGVEHIAISDKYVICEDGSTFNLLQRVVDP